MTGHVNGAEGQNRRKRSPDFEEQQKRQEEARVKAMATMLEGCRFGNLSQLKIEPEDPIFDGEAGGLATVDIWQVYAPTGVGKTLLAQPLAMAVACGGEFMGWQADKPRKVLYLDGEMPLTSMLERGALFKAPFSEEQRRLIEQNLTLLNREYMHREFEFALPALDSPQGKTFLMQVIAALEPELIVFDSRFCLLEAEMREAGSMPTELMNLLRAEHIAQIWLHHTGKDVARGGYGDSTAEWMLDATIELTREGDMIQWKFKKRRKMKPQNERFYQDRVLRLGLDGRWVSLENAPGKQRATQTQNAMAEVLDHIEALYDGKRPVSRGELRTRLAASGNFNTTKTGKALDRDTRKQVYRHIEYLVEDGLLQVEGDDLIPQRAAKAKPRRKPGKKKWEDVQGDVQAVKGERRAAREAAGTHVRRDDKEARARLAAERAGAE